MTDYERGYKDGMAGAALPNIFDNGDKINGYAYSYKTDSEGIPHININCVKTMLRKAADVQPVKRCRMIPLEPDCRGCTDVFICTNCHQHIHLGFIRKEYSGSYCLECGAEVEDGEQNDI